MLGRNAVILGIIATALGPNPGRAQESRPGSIDLADELIRSRSKLTVPAPGLEYAVSIKASNNGSPTGNVAIRLSLSPGSSDEASAGVDSGTIHVRATTAISTTSAGAQVTISIPECTVRCAGDDVPFDFGEAVKTMPGGRPSRDVTGVLELSVGPIIWRIAEEERKRSAEGPEENSRKLVFIPGLRAFPLGRPTLVVTSATELCLRVIPRPPDALGAGAGAPDNTPFQMVSPSDFCGTITIDRKTGWVRAADLSRTLKAGERTLAIEVLVQLSGPPGPASKPDAP